MPIPGFTSTSWISFGRTTTTLDCASPWPAVASIRSVPKQQFLIVDRAWSVHDRSGMRTCFQVGGPQLLTCSCIESAKTAIHCRSDKYHSAGSHNRAAKVGRPSRRLQLIYYPKWYFPNNLSLIHVHGVERSPGRFLAWPLVLVPEAGIFPFFGASPVSHWRVSSLRFHRSNGAQFICIHKEVAGSAIKRAAGPIGPTQCARYDQGHLATIRRVHSVALERMKQLSTITVRFRRNCADVAFAERVSNKRQRLDRKGLCRPGRFAGHVALGNRAFLHRK